MKKRVVIIGGGLTGILAAQTLIDQGIEDILIIEKSRSVGGRLATRRLKEGKVDHGAQFFTVKTPLFQTAVENWEKHKWVVPWFGNEAHPRYKSLDGMNGLARQLANGLPVQLQTKALTIHKEDNYYSIIVEGQNPILANGLILTPPAPQVLELIQEITCEAHVLEKLRSIQFNRCFVLLMRLNQTPNLSPSGLLSGSLPAGIDQLVDHQQKGMSEAATLSLYSTGEWANEQVYENDADVQKALYEKAIQIIEPSNILELQLKKWKYAEATQPFRQAFLDLRQPLPLLVAGDAFLHQSDPSFSARMESAFSSGVYVGEEMARQLKSIHTIY